MFYSSRVDEEPQFTEHITCPICGAAIPAVKMDVRIIARYTCPMCGRDIVIEEGKPSS